MKLRKREREVLEYLVEVGSVKHAEVMMWRPGPIASMATLCTKGLVVARLTEGYYPDRPKSVGTVFYLTEAGRAAHNDLQRPNKG